jgi:hypothetical protein
MEGGGFEPSFFVLAQHSIHNVLKMRIKFSVYEIKTQTGNPSNGLVEKPSKKEIFFVGRGFEIPTPVGMRNPTSLELFAPTNEVRSGRLMVINYLY